MSQSKIPEGWEEVAVGGVITENNKSKIQVGQANDTGKYKFFTSGEAVLKYDESLIDGENLFLATGGVANIKYHDGSCAYSTDTYSLKSLINAKFLYYLLLSKIEKINYSLFEGTGLKHLQKQEFKELKISIPEDLKEQKKIATILQTIDQTIDQTKKLIEKHKKMKEGLILDLLYKGIDKNGDIRDRAEQKFISTEIGFIPEDWKLSTVGQECEICNNLRKPISALEREKISGDYPYYGPTGILDHINEFRVEGRFVLIGEDGDHFLKYRAQPMTILVNGKFNVNNHAHILKGTKECLTEWIYFFFEHRDITLYLTRQGAGRYKLNKESLMSLPIAIPSIPEQKIIIQKLASFNKFLDKESTQLSKLQKMKSGLMQDLLTGKVRVTA